MSDTSRIRLLIVDDHPIVREGLINLIALHHDMSVVAEAGSGEEAVALHCQHRPDIVLMDLHMPGMSGIAAVRVLFQEYAAARIIVLTADDRDEFLFQSLRAGAKAFVMKSASREYLMTTIRSVYAGHTSLLPELAVKLAARLRLQELTDREHEVLALMAAGNSNLEIGNKLFISEATVKSHVNRVLNKMQVSDRTQAVVTAMKRGLVTLDEDTKQQA